VEGRDKEDENLELDLFPGNKISLRDIDEFISKNRIDLKSNDEGSD
jgi:hypothetical protein